MTLSPLSTTPPLLGRAGELATLDRLLGDVRHGRGHALVVRGEAGIGKSALLRHARDTAGDALVLHGGAVEAEAHLPFAGLHLLLHPVLHRIGELPAEQASALRRALGTGTGGRADRFGTNLAVLGLLALLARERPVLCSLDDAHWLDRASAEALLFAARRIGEHRALLLFAARDVHAPPFPSAGVPELRLSGLEPAAAEELLVLHAGDLPRHLREEVAAEARGNPLALIELSAAHREGRAGSRLGGIPGLPTQSRIQHSFADRIAGLPESTATLLLVAAADGTCDTGTVLDAATLLGCSIEDLRTAELEQLIMFTDNCIGFRHPLIRAAAYQSAPVARRLAAHRALAEVLDSEDNADRRAWQLAAASTGPDEHVARALEDTAQRARARGGYVAVADAYERAAALSPAQDERGRRLTAAARAAADAGQLERACELALQATTQLSDPVAQAWAAMIHATLSEDHGNAREAHRILARTAGSVAAREPSLAGKLLFWAAASAWSAGEPDATRAASALAEELGLPDAPLVRRLATAATAGVAEATSALRSLLDEQDELPLHCTDQPLALRGQAELARLHLLLGDDLTAHDLAAGVAADARAQTADGVLPHALAVLAEARLQLGDHEAALADASEGRRIAEDIGQRRSLGTLAGTLARLAAIEGAEQRTGTLAAVADPALAPAALGLLDLGLGRHEAALDRLTSLAGEAGPLDSVRVLPDLVEAAARARQPQRASAWLADYVCWAERTGRPGALAVALRSRALLGEPELFERAVELHAADGGQPFERARTELLYGEWLRRARRPARARALLRSAVAQFDRLGATPWAERARTELRASGESLTTAASAARAAERLTPQERRIARLAAAGLSNREIGSRLFLSPRTVGYHLYKAYPKLGVASRGELAKLELGESG